MRPLIAALSGSLLLFSVLSQAGAAPTGSLAVHCGHLLDTEAGKLLGESTVIISGKRIESVASGHQSPLGATEIDLSGETCLPGLIDSHTHLTHQSSPSAVCRQISLERSGLLLRSTVFARRTLLAGFTTVRNVGDKHMTPCRCATPSTRASSKGRAFSPPASPSVQAAVMRTDQWIPAGSGRRSRSSRRHHQQRRGCRRSRAPALQERRRPHQDHAFGRRARSEPRAATTRS